MWPLLSREDLKAAKKAPEFTSILPILIRRLIFETADGVGSIDIPGGSGIASPGFDGIVHSSQQTPFIPLGWSVWEFSVSGGNAKADFDYSKRQDLPSGLATTEVTYVQVILEPWTKARDWEAEKTQEGIWKEVRAYNLDRIDSWLEQAPGTTIWLATHLGKAVPGVQSLQSWWQDTWLSSTTVPLDENIVLAGREQAAQQLISALIDGRTTISLGGELRIEEAYAFLAASLQSSDAKHNQLTSRAIFISDYSNLGLLLQNHRSLILLVAGQDFLPIPSESNHQIISVSIPGIRSDITVPRIDDQSVRKILETNGMGSREAGQLSALGRRSMPALRRTLALKPELYIPEWAITPDPVLRRLLLFNSWNETNSADQNLIAEHLDLSTQDLESLVGRLTMSDEVPFLGRIERDLYVVAQEDAWMLLEHQLTSDDLEKLSSVAFTVLTEVDPLVGLEQSERLLAHLDGKRRRYSSTLRRGLATTLALLGSRNETVSDHGMLNAERYASVIVKRILQWANQNANFQHWLSLTDVLSNLAEAAPEEFVEAIRSAIESNVYPDNVLFTEDITGAISLEPTSPHVYLLWALETAAWFPDHIDEAVETIGLLATIDPGGQSSNRPIDSLVSILNPFHPNTSATTEDRVRCLRSLLFEHKEHMGELLIRLLPSHHATVLVKTGPRFSQIQREPITYEKRLYLWDTVLDLLIEVYGLDSHLMTAAIEKIAGFSARQRAQFLSHLSMLADQLNEEARSSIYYELRNTLAHHQEFQDSAWALPQDILDEMSEICEKLAPTTPSLKYRWLFEQGMFSLGDSSFRGDYKSREVELARLRTEALSFIVDEEGFEKIFDLATSSGWPEIVGSTLAQLSDAYDSTMLTRLSHTAEVPHKVASAYLAGRLSLEPKLRDQLLQESPNYETQATILLLTRDPETSKEALAKLDPEVAQVYWQRFPIYGLGSQEVESHKIATELIRFGRPAAAVQYMNIYNYEVDTNIETAEIIALAFESIVDNGLVDPDVKNLQAYEIADLFKILADHRDHLGEKRLALLEWNLYPLQAWKTDMPIFHTTLMRDPDLFVKLVSWAYPPDSMEPDGRVRDQETPTPEVASRAREVLRTCRAIPGAPDDQNIEYEPLFEWITLARKRLSDLDRLKIGETIIGEILSNSPNGTDGAPLHEAIRELIQVLKSERIEEGIYLGIINSRGVTSRGIYEGGDQERELAQNYLEHADTTRPWPRTRKIMQEVAKSYQSEATREDLSAERLRRDV